MKRWPLRMLLCLILGAITTVAVAWGCFIHLIPIAQEVDLIPGSREGSFLKIDATSSGVRERFEWGTSWFDLWAASARIDPELYDWTDQSHSIMVPATEILDEVQIDLIKQAYEAVVDADAEVEQWIFWENGEWFSRDRRAGWPVLSLSLRERHDQFALDRIESSTNGVVLPLGISQRLNRSAIPIVPIWPGFLIDTLFYGAIWFGVFFGFTSAKRFIRSKRGRCPRCGYDLRGDLVAGCSECGWNREESSP